MTRSRDECTTTKGIDLRKLFGTTSCHTHNCARLVIVATPVPVDLIKVKSLGNTVHDVTNTHVISVDAQTQKKQAKRC